MTEHDLAMLSSFHTTSLRKIQHIFISIRDLFAWCQQEDMETIITRKRWRWIGHVLHKDANSFTKSEGKRKSKIEEQEPQLRHHPEAGQ